MDVPLDRLDVLLTLLLQIFDQPGELVGFGLGLGCHGVGSFENVKTCTATYPSHYPNTTSLVPP